VNAAILVEKGFTGVMSVVRNLADEPENWQPGGFPLVTMMNVERRKGADKPVIKKALVELEGPLFGIFAAERAKWAVEDLYRSTGPIQFEFRCLTPFLVKAPNYENIYHFITKDYDAKSAPFHAIDPRYNVSELSFDRVKKIPELPEILESNEYTVVKHQALKFKNEETRLASEENFKFVIGESSQLIEVLNRPQLHQESKPLPRRTNLKIGVSFNGRQTPGGHSILEGLLRFCQRNHSTLYGFLAGTKGILEGSLVEITDEALEFYRNQGGFTFLGRSADKLRTPEELEKTKATC
jgi:hypothetical protein